MAVDGSGGGDGRSWQKPTDESLIDNFELRKDSAESKPRRPEDAPDAPRAVNSHLAHRAKRCKRRTEQYRLPAGRNRRRYWLAGHCLSRRRAA